MTDADKLIQTSEEDDNKRAADHWSESTPDTDTFSSNMFWLAVPEVQEHYLANGTQNSGKGWVFYFFQKYLPIRQENVTMASVGCGVGHLERNLASWNAFDQCDGFDIAPGALDIARKLAAEAGIENLNYAIQDMNTYIWPENHYDVVWFSHSLHHIKNLEGLYEQLTRTLKPGGYVFFNEYIGPDRFDFTKRQKEVMSAAFTLIPQRFRRSFNVNYPHAFYQSVSIPDPNEVHRLDPSESVRSSEIMPLLHQYFDVVEFNKAGGTLLHFLLSGIAGNFRADDPESMQVLKMLFNIEDTLIGVGDIQSDFAIVAAQPKVQL